MDKCFPSLQTTKVVVNGVKSNWAPVMSRLPQVTVLVQLLFSLYINDISVDIESEDSLLMILSAIVKSRMKRIHRNFRETLIF